MAVLDASFLADLDRGHAPAALLLAALADEGSALVVPAASLLAFLARARDPARAALEVAARFEVVPLAPEEAVRGAPVAKAARRAGAAVAVDEAAAAGAALLRGEPLVTARAEAFLGVEGLEVLTYR